MTFSDLEGHFCCLKPLHLIYLWKYSVYYLKYVYTWIGKCMSLVISSMFLRTKDFLRSQPVTFTVSVISVIIFCKQCQIASFLLQTTNRKWYMTYQIEAIPMTLSHLQGHSYWKPESPKNACAVGKNCFFSTGRDSRSLRLRCLTTENLCPSATVIRVCSLSCSGEDVHSCLFRIISS